MQCTAFMPVHVAICCAERGDSYQMHTIPEVILTSKIIINILNMNVMSGDQDVGTAVPDLRSLLCVPAPAEHVMSRSQIRHQHKVLDVGQPMLGLLALSDVVVGEAPVFIPVDCWWELRP